ncbi:MAG: NAD-binding protein, partial [Eubacterium sp.]|nr:NAD-binding protein [Eubacterium sp.]
MNIIIAGCGNVGGTLAEQLSQEEHRITVIDTNAKIVEEISDSFDVYGVVGTGSSINVLEEANIDDCDLFIAVTGNDEMNLLACLIAKSRGVKNLIARVGNPEYGREIGLI